MKVVRPSRGKGLTDQPTIIIGGSHAGLLCAGLLAREGVAVELFDQCGGPEEAMPRTLIVTAELAGVFNGGGHLPVRNTISAFRVWVDGQCLQVPIAQPDLVVERRDLICTLAEWAASCGARLHWRAQLVSVSPTRAGFELLLLDRREGRFFRRTASTLIAADGVRSTVAQCLRCNGRLAVPILQARVRSEKPMDAHVVDTWFLPERTPYFYWQIPDSEHTAAVGFVARDASSARQEFSRFVRELGYQPQSVEAALVPLYDPFAKPYWRYGEAELYFVGDAAGQVKVTTVGGTVTGLAGAQAAARAILNGTSYLEELRALRRELNVHYLIRRVMDRFTTGDYQRLITCLHRRVLALLRDVPRDRFASVFIRLLLAQPAIVACAARALLRPAGRSR